MIISLICDPQMICLIKIVNWCASFRLSLPEMFFTSVSRQAHALFSSVVTSHTQRNNIWLFFLCLEELFLKSISLKSSKSNGKNYFLYNFHDSKWESLHFLINKQLILWIFGECVTSTTWMNVVAFSTIFHWTKSHFRILPKPNGID